MGDGSRMVYEGRKFTVEQIGARTRDGETHQYDVVRHPGAAVILPIMDDGRALLISNHRIAVGCDLLELPAGTIDPPEPAIECARRELAEETGYTAAEMAPLVSFYSSPGICNELLHAFVATGLTAGDSALEPGEWIEPAPMKLEESLAAIEAGRITDGKTIVTLMYYDKFARSVK
jgi:ADP-ribose pyrophosphatase